MTRILIADRDQAIAQLLSKAVLRSVDCEVRLAHDSETAAALLENEAFNLILLDIGMYSDGLSTLRRVRDRNAHCQVVAITTGVIAAPLVKLLAEQDVYAVVTKPFDVQQLSAIVGEALRSDRVADPNNPLVYRKAGSHPSRE